MTKQTTVVTGALRVNNWVRVFTDDTGLIPSHKQISVTQCEQMYSRTTNAQFCLCVGWSALISAFASSCGCPQNLSILVWFSITHQSTLFKSFRADQLTRTLCALTEKNVILELAQCVLVGGGGAWGGGGSVGSPLASGGGGGGGKG